MWTGALYLIFCNIHITIKKFNHSVTEKNSWTSHLDKQRGEKHSEIGRIELSGTEPNRGLAFKL